MNRISDYLAGTFGITGNLDAAAGDADAEALIAAIIVLAAQSDGTIGRAESAKLQALISDRFASADHETIEHAAEPSQRIPDLSRPGDIIERANRTFSLPQKEALLLMVLQVIAADERKERGELEFLDQLVTGLEISTPVMDRIYARYFEGKRN